MNNSNVINSCEVCGNKDLTPVLDLGFHPICDDLIPNGSSYVNEEFPVVIHYCENCFTAHQVYQIPKNRLFPKTYHYRARFTKDVLDGMQGLVRFIEDTYKPVRNLSVLDVGCNDGSLLDFFKQLGANTYGVEPTDAALEAKEKGHDIIQDYFSKELLASLPNPDIITFTNVFAHIEDLDTLLVNIKALLKKDTLLVIENHYLGGVLEKMQFDTFYHEHPRTYSFESFKFIADKLGMKVLSVEFPSRYGGNIRVVIGDPSIYKVAEQDQNEIHAFESTFSEKFKNMDSFIRKWQIEKKEEILDYNKKFGKISAKAFPARAALPIKLLGLTEENIKCVFEKPGSPKIGHYVPGTRIPIVSDAEFIKDISSFHSILNNAWHISNEIEQYLRKLGFKGEIINVI